MSIISDKDLFGYDDGTGYEVTTEDEVDVKNLPLKFVGNVGEDEGEKQEKRNEVVEKTVDKLFSRKDVIDGVPGFDALCVVKNKDDTSTDGWKFYPVSWEEFCQDKNIDHPKIKSAVGASKRHITIGFVDNLLECVQDRRVMVQKGFLACVRKATQHYMPVIARLYKMCLIMMKNTPYVMFKLDHTNPDDMNARLSIFIGFLFHLTDRMKLRNEWDDKEKPESERLSEFSKFFPKKKKKKGGKIEKPAAWSTENMGGLQDILKEMLVGFPDDPLPDEWSISEEDIEKIEKDSKADLAARGPKAESGFGFVCKPLKIPKDTKVFETKAVDWTQRIATEMENLKEEASQKEDANLVLPDNQWYWCMEEMNVPSPEAGKHGGATSFSYRAIHDPTGKGERTLLEKLDELSKHPKFQRHEETLDTQWFRHLKIPRVNKDTPKEDVYDANRIASLNVSGRLAEWFKAISGAELQINDLKSEYEERIEVFRDELLEAEKCLKRLLLSSRAHELKKYLVFELGMIGRVTGENDVYAAYLRCMCANYVRQTRVVLMSMRFVIPTGMRTEYANVSERISRTPLDVTSKAALKMVVALQDQNMKKLYDKEGGDEFVENDNEDFETAISKKTKRDKRMEELVKRVDTVQDSVFAEDGNMLGTDPYGLKEKKPRDFLAITSGECREILMPDDESDFHSFLVYEPGFVRDTYYEGKVWNYRSKYTKFQDIENVLLSPVTRTYYSMWDSFDAQKGDWSVMKDDNSVATFHCGETLSMCYAVLWSIEYVFREHRVTGKDAVNAPDFIRKCFVFINYQRTFSNLLESMHTELYNLDVNLYEFLDTDTDMGTSQFKRWKRTPDFIRYHIEQYLLGCRKVAVFMQKVLNVLAKIIKRLDSITKPSDYLEETIKKKQWGERERPFSHEQFVSLLYVTKFEYLSDVVSAGSKLEAMIKKMETSVNFQKRDIHQRMLGKEAWDKFKALTHSKPHYEVRYHLLYGFYGFDNVKAVKLWEKYTDIIRGISEENLSHLYFIASMKQVHADIDPNEKDEDLKWFSPTFWITGSEVDISPIKLVAEWPQADKENDILSLIYRGPRREEVPKDDIEQARGVLRHITRDIDGCGTLINRVMWCLFYWNSVKGVMGDENWASRVFFDKRTPRMFREDKNTAEKREKIKRKVFGIKRDKKTPTPPVAKEAEGKKEEATEEKPTDNALAPPPPPPVVAEETEGGKGEAAVEEPKEPRDPNAGDGRESLEELYEKLQKRVETIVKITEENMKSDDGDEEVEENTEPDDEEEFITSIDTLVHDIVEKMFNLSKLLDSEHSRGGVEVTDEVLKSIEGVLNGFNPIVLIMNNLLADTARIAGECLTNYKNEIQNNGPGGKLLLRTILEAIDAVMDYRSTMFWMSENDALVNFLLAFSNGKRRYDPNSGVGVLFRSIKEASRYYIIEFFSNRSDEEKLLANETFDKWWKNDVAVEQEDGTFVWNSNIPKEILRWFGAIERFSTTGDAKEPQTSTLSRFEENELVPIEERKSIPINVRNVTCTEACYITINMIRRSILSSGVGSKAMKMLRDATFNFGRDAPGLPFRAAVIAHPLEFSDRSATKLLPILVAPENDIFTRDAESGYRKGTSNIRYVDFSPDDPVSWKEKVERGLENLHNDKRGKGQEKHAERMERERKLHRKRIEEAAKKKKEEMKKAAEQEKNAAQEKREDAKREATRKREKAAKKKAKEARRRERKNKKKGPEKDEVDEEMKPEEMEKDKPQAKEIQNGNDKGGEDADDDDMMDNLDEDEEEQRQLEEAEKLAQHAKEQKRMKEKMKKPAQPEKMEESSSSSDGEEEGEESDKDKGGLEARKERGRKDDDDNDDDDVEKLFKDLVKQPQPKDKKKESNSSESKEEVVEIDSD